ncbi:MAG: type II toxin-antitoxin system VapC family toxin [Betaproteobacteria bacterium]
MQLLLDTHLLLWAAEGGRRIPGKLRKLISNEEHALFFSVASLWEIAIKAGLGRPDFTLDASVFRRLLIDNGYTEIAISGSHVITANSLPPLHRDPFDRLLVAQAISEGFTLLTSDPALAGYPGDIVIA